MADQLDPTPPTEAFAERLAALFGTGVEAKLAEISCTSFSLLPPAQVQRAFAELALALIADPGRAIRAQARLWRDGLALWHAVAEAGGGGAFEPPFAQVEGDRRFKDPAWRDGGTWTYLQQTHLLLARWLDDLVGEAELTPEARRLLRFMARQYASAMAPSNFALTNPAVLRRAHETQGRSLAEGLQRLAEDLARGAGRLSLRTVDERAFAVGRNLAITPGRVIFRNELIELIQYAPTTAHVHARPLLLVPPWINKYYILDLQPRNSFVRHAVAQGFTVFLISWVDPPAELAARRFEDYVREGPLAALAAIEAAVGTTAVNVLGFCIGGVLVATLLAHLAARGDDRVASATFLATLFDFADVGEMGVFVDPAQVAALEAHTAQTGFLEGRYLADMFSLLRENDLIWPAFIDGYLMGVDPPAFDLLYWNADATRLPAAMLSDYLRGFYLNNAFARPGTLEVLGTPVDTRRIAVPTYALATRDDHIAPWRSCLPVVEQFAGPVRFVLGGSGHVAGVVNPPERGKYGYWTREDAFVKGDWLAGATRHAGSWWPDWLAWLRRHAGPMVPARDPDAGGLAPLGDAPGTYVMVRGRGPEA